jgi:hypothetical protein
MAFFAGAGAATAAAGAVARFAAVRVFLEAPAAAVVPADLAPRVPFVGPEVAAFAFGAVAAGAFLAAFFAASDVTDAFVAFAEPALVTFAAATLRWAAAAVLCAGITWSAASPRRGAVLFAAFRTASARSAMAFPQTYKTGARPGAAHSEDGKNTEPVVPRQTSHTHESPFVYGTSTITPLVTAFSRGRRANARDGRAG